MPPHTHLHWGDIFKIILITVYSYEFRLSCFTGYPPFLLIGSQWSDSGGPIWAYLFSFQLVSVHGLLAGGPRILSPPIDQRFSRYLIDTIDCLRSRTLKSTIILRSRTLDQLLLLCKQTGSGGCCHWLWRLRGLAQSKRHQAHVVQRDGNTLSDLFDVWDRIYVTEWFFMIAVIWTGVCGTQRGRQGCLSGFHTFLSPGCPSHVRQGDSGGPLMTQDDSGQWRLLGLVSGRILFWGV